MSSTSSSADVGSARSPTETLASRYRHLFVLPSVLTLIAFGGFVTLLLSLASYGGYGVVFFIPAVVAFVASSLVVSRALRATDHDTVATFRRTTAVLAVGGTVWLACVTAGLLYSLLTGSAFALANGFLFGAFLCGAFEFLVISGTFTENAYFALALSAIHPTATLLILRLQNLEGGVDPVTFLLGVLAFVILGSLTIQLKRFKTPRGSSAISLFQAFIKTWAGGTPDSLESIIAEHSAVEGLTTKVMRFSKEDGDIFIVLPGVHPGPFHPVGSYNLPGVVSKTFVGLGPVLTLHRPGGHERNLATGRDTVEFAGKLKEFAGQIKLNDGLPMIRGPTSSRIDKATVSSTGFVDDLLLTITFSPLGSDDIDLGTETWIKRIADSANFDASVVDAHNSIDDDQVTLGKDEPAWVELFDRARGTELRPFRTAYAHSSEVGLTGRAEDLTDNGIGLMLFEVGGTKHVLVLADANNAVPALRGATETALDSAGYKLIELCTSDSHDLAAKGLTVPRGYKPLGESTSPDLIAKTVVEMAKRAETRLSGCRYGSGVLSTDEKVFGSRALDEFAKVTLASSRLGKAYLKYATPAVLVLLFLSLIF